MKTVQVDVKSKGTVVATIEVNQFETLDEAKTSLGEEKCLGLINRQNKADESNEARASLTRDVKPETKLMRAAKSNPRIKARMDELLAEFGIA